MQQHNVDKYNSFSRMWKAVIVFVYITYFFYVYQHVTTSWTFHCDSCCITEGLSTNHFHLLPASSDKLCVFDYSE